MLAILTATLMTGCFPLVFPEAKDVRATHGKPDRHEVATCGGAQDEYGKPIAKWKCLVWTYEGKGRIYFSTDQASEKGWYLVFGCGTSKTRVEKQDHPYWLLSGCSTSTGKEAGCREVGLSANLPETFNPVPEPSDDGDEAAHRLAFVRWLVQQPQVCFSEADAKQVAKTCAEKATEPAKTVPFEAPKDSAL